jgi:hypothetical protein
MDLETDLRSALLSATAVHAGDHGALTLLDTYGFERVHLAPVDDPEIFGYTEQGDDALLGTSWTVRRLRDPALFDEDLRAIRREMEGDDLVVTFGAESRIIGSTGCGELTGDYRTERSWIAIHASPERPCDDADKAWTESILLDALDRAGSITLDEWLVLRDRPGGTILLSAEPRN